MGDQYQDSAESTKTIEPNTNPDVMRLRLDPDPLLERIELYLRGAKVTYKEIDGKILPMVIKYGLPLANNIGVQNILRKIANTVNPHVVQGNFPSDQKGYSWQYETYIYSWRVNFSTYLMVNLYNFEVDENEYEGIIDTVMELIEPFMTRLIDNEERKNYGTTNIDQKTNTVRGKNGINLFNNKNSNIT